MLQVPRNLKDILISAQVAADSASRDVNESFEALSRSKKYHDECKRRVEYWQRLVNLEANSFTMKVPERPDSDPNDDGRGVPGADGKRTFVETAD